MATWGELSKFTWGDLRAAHYTWDELNRMSYDELMQIAQTRLEHFLPKTESESKLKTFLSSLLLKITEDVAASAIKSVDWLDVLRKVVDFIQDYFD